MTAAVREGDVLNGKYRVDRVIGAGGMGVVVLATHLRLEQKVAIKVLLPGTVAEGKDASRFAREARAAAKIKGDHAVRILDVDDSESGAPFIVMEYLEGCDLDQLIKGSGPLPIPTAIDYLLQACEVVAEAHALGIVHRDLKPANLFLAARDDGSKSIKLLDFGISKQSSETENVSLTDTSTSMGSPLFMSPEQLRSSKDVDTRTDIWSLGIVLYHLLSGALPFDGDTPTALAARIAADPPLPLSSIRPGLPSALERAVMRCLEKDREKRFATVIDLARAIAPFMAEKAAGAEERVARVVHAAAMGQARKAGRTGETVPPPAPIPDDLHSAKTLPAVVDVAAPGSSTEYTTSVASSGSPPGKAIWPVIALVTAGAAMSIVGWLERRAPPAAVSTASVSAAPRDSSPPTPPATVTASPPTPAAISATVDAGPPKRRVTPARDPLEIDLK